ncbi:Rieske [2Fe-2S] iron-sulfur domain-containing protein [Gemmatirosa kalamazoonensis]|uniref:Rieske [2Fe-2S] iron-sulfur domain-containing protein n=1 Tax=Gemmatirosa kalamazoonensis TaxID=861299 RepID=W0RJN3_9BACT|nr:Rieske 2Fe-2S domain-containing protein [Gemmatirosa kalamazoonensis]AHG89623.1 Rieske [2Fe-2S] iron-sulfur domain-containing protein [Gemmatirosa kalamazoonensis]
MTDVARPADATDATDVPPGFERAARLDDVPATGLLGVEMPRDRVCIARLGDEVYAFEDRCSHALYPMSRGELRADGTLVCGWHGATFDCRTGAVCRGPASIDLQQYDVLIRDGDVYVRLRS